MLTNLKAIATIEAIGNPKAFYFDLRCSIFLNTSREFAPRSSIAIKPRSSSMHPYCSNRGNPTFQVTHTENQRNDDKRNED